MRPVDTERYVIARLEMDGVLVLDAFIPRDRYHLVVEGFSDVPHLAQFQNVNLVDKVLVIYK